MDTKVQTVLGDIDPKELGRTLTHEHLGMNFDHFYRKPPSQISNKFNGINLQNVGFVRQYPYSSRYNLDLNDSDARWGVQKDLELFKQCGGGTIVENTTYGLNRNVSFYEKISEDTNVHIVAGTGFYIEDMQADSDLHMTKEELYERMLTEINEGCIDYPKVKAGFLGEIASVWPIRVLGDIDPKELGRTLTHEHLGMNFDHFYRKPPSQISNKFNGINLQNVGFVRQYPYSSRYNLDLNDSDARWGVQKDLELFKQCGGGTIVENTTYGLNRNVSFYEKISEDTNVHIVAGTGFYIEDMQADSDLHMTKEELYERMLTEINEGCIDYPKVKAGFLGEIASVWPIRDFERRVIQAAGEVQAQLGCGVSFHPHRSPEAPFEIMRLYLEAGGKADKAVMSHLDRTVLDLELLSKFAELGSYCQFDLFGTEVSYYQLNVTTDMPSDAKRIELIRHLVEEKKADRVLMSHDIHTKHRLSSFGGHGYSHILVNVLSRMKSKGFSLQVLDQITIENPAKWLAMKNN